ncbi:hypothetical protein BDV96DRAFT_664674 [Lophiotrema nucula]|uniref:Uncharacterized protein n=1 Tax=Lophiotrema nucula TaxID=690887 RepID=A0A6A5Z1W2_9PLEO|nr:hypothetical protein BDV96DRAFT_664674 [Lophiotrema nucula]
MTALSEAVQRKQVRLIDFTTEIRLNIAAHISICDCQTPYQAVSWIQWRDRQRSTLRVHVYKPFHGRVGSKKRALFERERFKQNLRYAPSRRLLGTVAGMPSALAAGSNKSKDIRVSATACKASNAATSNMTAQDPDAASHRTSDSSQEPGPDSSPPSVLVTSFEPQQ